MIPHRGQTVWKGVVQCPIFSIFSSSRTKWIVIGCSDNEDKDDNDDKDDKFYDDKVTDLVVDNKNNNSSHDDGNGVVDDFNNLIHDANGRAGQSCYIIWVPDVYDLSQSCPFPKKLNSSWDWRVQIFCSRFT